jgi:hypothetical protein
VNGGRKVKTQVILLPRSPFLIFAALIHPSSFILAGIRGKLDGQEKQGKLIIEQRI